MRELSDAELELVSGGIDTLFVTAFAPDWEGGGSPPISTNDPGYSDNGSGGGGGSESSSLPSSWDATLDQQIDALAQQVNAAIQAKPDHDVNEYGALFWKDANGVVHTTSLIKGDNFGLTGLNTTTTPQSLGFQSWDQVIGMIHSHPTIAQARDLNGVPQYDSNGAPITIAVTPESHFERPSDGDFDWPDYFAAPRTGVTATVNDDMFRSYISYKNTVTEYDYYNNDNTNLTGVQRSVGAVAAN